MEDVIVLLAHEVSSSDIAPVSSIMANLFINMPPYLIGFEYYKQYESEMSIYRLVFFFSSGVPPV